MPKISSFVDILRGLRALTFLISLVYFPLTPKPPLTRSLSLPPSLSLFFYLLHSTTLLPSGFYRSLPLLSNTPLQGQNDPFQDIVRVRRRERFFKDSFYFMRWNSLPTKLILWIKSKSNYLKCVLRSIQLGYLCVIFKNLGTMYDAFNHPTLYYDKRIRQHVSSRVQEKEK